MELPHGLCRENAADAVIVCLMKFISRGVRESMWPSQRTERRGITVLSVDIGTAANSYDQARTRIETLAEMLQKAGESGSVRVRVKRRRTAPRTLGAGTRVP